MSTSKKAVRRRAAWSALSVSAATVLALTACTSGGGGALGAGGDATSKAGGGHTLVVATSEAPWNPAYAAVVAQYEKDTGNKVELRDFPNGDVKTQEINDIQNGQHAFDVYQINEPDMVTFMSNKWVQPFDSIDKGYKLDKNIFSYDNLPYWDATKRVFASGGELTSAPINGNLQIFMYRADIYKKLGLKVPKSWDQIISNGQKAMKAGDAKYGGVFTLQGSSTGAALSYYFEAILAGEGGKWFANEGSDWTPQLDSSEAIHAAEVLRELAQLGPTATNTMGQAQTLAAMQAGDAAQTFLVTAAAAQLEDPANSNIGGKVGYAPLPNAPEGKPGSATGIWSLTVPAGLDKTRSQVALDFIKYVTSQKAQTLFAQKGGVPIRSDYGTSNLSAPTKAALSATGKSATGAVGQFRYSFAPQMLQQTEPVLASIAAGTVSPEAGMQQLQAAVSQVIKDAKLPMKG